MTVIVRRFAAVPQRSSVDTWAAIVAMVAPDTTSDGRGELEAVSGTVAAMIASEITGPIVFKGVGPLLRVYCLYGDAAMEGEEVNEQPLGYVPTAGDWQMFLPCPLEDLSWVRHKLESSKRVRAHDESEPMVHERQNGALHQALAVDPNAFFGS